jgi:FixJ family two-component response regulator
LDISILISDLIMPRMGGRELARLAAKMHDLRFIFMSGYPDETFSDGQDRVGGPNVVLQKPFTMEVLLSCIADLTRPDIMLPNQLPLLPIPPASPDPHT